jgi:phenylpyruvate tautomerase PptA (4-oxalocrotonate tautomerase family)
MDKSVIDKIKFKFTKYGQEITDPRITQDEKELIIKEVKENIALIIEMLESENPTVSIKISDVPNDPNRYRYEWSILGDMKDFIKKYPNRG